MNKLSWSLSAAVLLAGGIAIAPAASAAPMPVVQIEAQHPLLTKVRWIHHVDRAGRRSLVWLRRHGRKRTVASNPNVDRPDRPASQAGWGQMPGGPRRYGQ